jgi:D-alanine-D-alanine ligase
MDKLRTKWWLQGAGLQTPAWYLLTSKNDIDSCISHLGFPVIVKPAQEGSSFGMSKAEDYEQLVAAYQLAAKYNCDVYAEAWVEGDEYTVAILAGKALPAIRLETPNAFYDYNAKYEADTTQYHCPCGLDAQQEQQLQAIAVKACDITGVEGWARVDLFIDKASAVQLIEINTVPGMTDHSLVPMAAKQQGLSFDDLVWNILETTKLMAS